MGGVDGVGGVGGVGEGLCLASSLGLWIEGLRPRIRIHLKPTPEFKSMG